MDFVELGDKRFVTFLRALRQNRAMLSCAMNEEVQQSDSTEIDQGTSTQESFSDQASSNASAEKCYVSGSRSIKCGFACHAGVCVFGYSLWHFVSTGRNESFAGVLAVDAVFIRVRGNI